MPRYGNIELDVPVYQAPLSGYTDRPMRLLARRFGCPLTFTGVMLDKIALHSKAIRKAQFQVGDDERPVGAQILGASPETMALAARNFAAIGYDAVDLNFACPAPKVLHRGRGGHLLGQPSRVIETLERVKEAVDCPVSMKLRIGVQSDDDSRELFWEIMERAAAIGPDVITIHGRTVSARYRGRADWNVLTEAKRRFPQVTIFGSGDVMAPQTVLHRCRTSGLDGVCIARGAVGNPWIFRDSRALLEGRSLPEPPDVREVGELMLEHFLMILELRPENKAVPYFRKFAANYCRRHPERKKAMLAIMAARTRDAVIHEIKDHFGV